jgi:alkylation response protein AidB-like acyl-CoA dehydrogenase
MDGVDFDLSAEQLAFERDVRAFIEDEVSAEDLWSPEAHADEHSSPIYAQLARRGWLGMNIPAEYGGQGRGAVDLAIFRDWTSYYRLPIGGFTAGSRIGHALHLLGTDDQRRQFLPGMVAGNLLMCIGYTEPEAGSDLASLRTRARRDGDGFVVSGQKIFTTAGHLADWIFLACRTDPEASPRHRGISVLMVDLTSPGVRIDPIWTLGGWRLNTIFLDDVRVPAANVVGELHGGWRVVRTALAVERTGIQPVAMARRTVDDLWDIVRTDPHLLVVDPAEATRLLTEAEAEVAGARWHAYRLAWAQDRGTISAADSATSKLLGSEVYQRAATLTYRLLGGDVFRRGGGHPAVDALEREYRYAPQATIAAGTSEIMRNLVAKEALRLPVLT